jgi:hydrogenase nickel incorporation protein HypA/HybF
MYRRDARKAMHELSIAMSVLDLASEELARQGEARAAAIHLRLGPLSGVVKQALLSAFEMAREEHGMGDCKFIVEDVPLVAFCPVCGVNRDIPSVQYICCPVCDAPTPKIISGRELDMVAMELYA